MQELRERGRGHVDEWRWSAVVFVFNLLTTSCILWEAYWTIQFFYRKVFVDEAALLDIANRDNPDAVADAWFAQLALQELRERGRGHVDEWGWSAIVFAIVDQLYFVRVVIYYSIYKKKILWLSSVGNVPVPLGYWWNNSFLPTRCRQSIDETLRRPARRQ